MSCFSCWLCRYFRLAYVSKTVVNFVRARWTTCSSDTLASCVFYSFSLVRWIINVAWLQSPPPSLWCRLSLVDHYSWLNPRLLPFDQNKPSVNKSKNISICEFWLFVSDQFQPLTGESEQTSLHLSAVSTWTDTQLTTETFLLLNKLNRIKEEAAGWSDEPMTASRFTRDRPLTRRRHTEEIWGKQTAFLMWR